MAKSRIRPSSLAKLFENSPVLVYVLNLDFEIVYANQSCAQWAGIEVEQLIGQRCIYTSSELDNETKNRIRGLCPPPEIAQTLAIETTIFCEDRQGIRYRNAHFTRLDNIETNGNSLIFAITEACDRPAPLHSKEVDLHTQLTELRHELNAHFTLNQLAGQSPAAQRMRRQANVAIKSDSDVLILGPPSTGKAQLARTIFNERKQTDDQLITLQGATTDHITLQETIKNWVYDQRNRTGKDWLLIKDIDQLNSATQQELFGFTQIPNFRLRLLATSTRPLLEIARHQEYNNDLAYYLSTMIIQTDALSERMEDIPLLVQAFIEEQNTHQAKQVSGCSQPALELLAQCRWSRNLDQLHQAVLQAWDNATRPTIQIEDFPDSVQQLAKATPYEPQDQTEIQLESYLESIERELIQRALIHGKQNKTKAAKLLGINRAKLLRRLNHFDLTGDKTGDENRVDSSAFMEADETDGDDQ